MLALRYSPDGSMLAVGMRDPHTVLLLDPTTLAVRGRLQGHLAQIARLSFLPDGKTLVSPGHDGTVRTWDIATRRQRLLIDSFQGNVRGLAIGPDGKRIFTGEASRQSKGTTQTWDARDGRLLGTVLDYDHGIEDLKVSPDGLTLATSSRDKSVRLWDAVTLAQKNSFNSSGPFASELAYTPDGKTLATTWSDKTIRLFEVATMRPRYQVETTAQAFLYLAVSPDGTILATTDGKGLELRRLADGSPLATVPDTGGQTASIEFSPDGRSVAVGGLAGFVRVFQLNHDGK